MKILKAALLGRSLDHSISPEVHRQLFELVRSKCNSEYASLDYSKIECANEQEFQTCVEAGAENGHRGFNVTFPYKFAASEIAGVSSPVVQQIHSANTVLCEEPLKIASTDGDGFRFAIEKGLPNLQPDSYALSILGAGGAARAVLHAVQSFGWRSIVLAARSIEEARRAAAPYPHVTVTSIAEFARDAVPQFIVQATPVGQRSKESLLTDFRWLRGDIAVDLVYNPLRTRFLDFAASGGARTIDGLGMLMEQAALSQYFWMTGSPSEYSLLTPDEFITLHHSLSKLLTPRWDDFGI